MGGDDDTDSEIFLYDSTITRQITNNDYQDYEPQINDNGEIVWYGQDGGTDYDIFLYEPLFLDGESGGCFIDTVLA